MPTLKVRYSDFVAALPAATGVLDADDRIAALEDGVSRAALVTDLGVGGGTGPLISGTAQALAGADDTTALSPAKAAIRDEKYDVQRSLVVGNGSDETTEFAAAVATVQAARGTLFVPPGFTIGVDTGTVSTTIQITDSMRLHFGDGAGLVAVSGTRALLQVEADDFEIDGGIFDGAGIGGAGVGLIDLIGDAGGTTVRNTVRNARVFGAAAATGYGIRAERINGLVVDGVTVIGGKFGINATAYSGGTDGCRITGCTADMSGATASGSKGIAVSGTASDFVYDGVVIANNVVRGPGSGVASTLGIETWRIAASPVIDGNDIDAFAYGISTAVCNSPSINGNTIRNGYSYGIEAALCRYPSIVGNTIRAGRIQVNSSSVALGATIVGNTVDGTQNTAAHHAIHTVGVPDVVIVGNTVYATRSDAYGIHAQNVLRAVVSSNAVSGNTTLFGAINIGAAGSTTAKSTVVGNHVRDVSTWGTVLTGNPSTHESQYLGNIFDSSAGTEYGLGSGVTRSARCQAITGTQIGVFGTAPAAKQTVTGSRGGNAALASLLTALATYGLLTDSSSA